jgi:hypothetical protein
LLAEAAGAGVAGGERRQGGDVVVVRAVGGLGAGALEAVVGAQVEEV